MDCIKKDNRTKQDLITVVNIFKVVAEIDLLEVKWRYGRCLSIGLGIEADKERGSQILKKIMNESPEAKFFYALCLPEEDREKRNILQELLDKNDPICFWHYGLTLLKEASIEKQKEGRKLLENAVVLERKRYLSKIGEFYQNGLFGFLNDKKRSVKLYQQSNSISFLDEEFFYPEI